jgi:phosphoglycolate phosphatase-like HAD superfamily hydrolase
MSDKLILIDVDGTILDWKNGFIQFLALEGVIEKDTTKYKVHEWFQGLDEQPITEEKGKFLIEYFNRSAWIAFLDPLRDSVEVIQALKAKGYEFRAITSLHRDKPAQMLRRMNLDNTFGEGTISDITFLPTGADKDEALAEYKDSGAWWIEDKVENAVVGKNLGLKPIIVEHEYNKDVYTHEIPTAKFWSTIYKTITGERYVGSTQ